MQKCVFHGLFGMGAESRKFPREAWIQVQRKKGIGNINPVNYNKVQSSKNSCKTTNSGAYPKSHDEKKTTEQKIRLPITYIVHKKIRVYGHSQHIKAIITSHYLDFRRCLNHGEIHNKFKKHQQNCININCPLSNWKLEKAKRVKKE